MNFIKKFNFFSRFEESAELINADKKMKKTMWGQFWSSHQRFFKYLCIASKVTHLIYYLGSSCKKWQYSSKKI
jgi:hypothetical protein